MRPVALILCASQLLSALPASGMEAGLPVSRRPAPADFSAQALTLGLDLVRRPLTAASSFQVRDWLAPFSLIAPRLAAATGYSIFAFGDLAGGLGSGGAGSELPQDPRAPQINETGRRLRAVTSSRPIRAVTRSRAMRGLGQAWDAAVAPAQNPFISPSHPVPFVNEALRKQASVPAPRSMSARLASAAAAAVQPLAAVAPGRMLSADRANYVVDLNEAPSYTIEGAPANEPIFWTMELNGAVVVNDQNYGQSTDGNGEWTGTGSPWSPVQTGHWKITARVGDQRSTMRFSVVQNFDGMNPSDLTQAVGNTTVAGDYFNPSPYDGEPKYLRASAKQSLSMGSKRLFIYATPQYKTDNPGDDFGDQPEQNLTNLTQLVQTPAYVKLFELPIPTFVITAYTFTSWNEFFLNRNNRFTPELAAKEQQEMADLAYFLAARYPDKKFILKNWEGDWQLQNALNPDGGATPEQVEDFKAWLAARQAGVRDGLARAQQENGNVSGDAVQNAIEFNLPHLAQQDAPSMLTSVLKDVDSDLVSYSSWYSIGRGGDRRRNIKDDITFVRSLPELRGRKVIVTEAGVANSLAEDVMQQVVNDFLETFSELGIDSITIWELFNNGVPFGLTGDNFKHFASYFAVRAKLGGTNGASIQAGADASRWVSGQPLPITVTNQGTTPWYAASAYELVLLDDQGNQVGSEMGIAQPVGPGESVSFPIPGPRLELAPGTYRLVMRQRGVENFGDPLTITILDPGSFEAAHIFSAPIAPLPPAPRGLRRSA